MLAEQGILGYTSSMENPEGEPKADLGIIEVTKFITAFGRADDLQEMRDAWDNVSAYIKREDVPLLRKSMVLQGVVASRAPKEIQERATTALENLAISHEAEQGVRKLEDMLGEEGEKESE